MAVNALALAAQRLAESTQPPQDAAARWARRYLHDPVGFARDCVNWTADRHLFDYQGDILNHLVIANRVAVRGPRGLGKTALSALAVLWFALTRDLAGIDWKVGTTAGSFPQLQHYTWPEIHKWAKLLRWDVIGRPALNERTELLNMHLRLRHGDAFASSPADPYLIEGAHADHVLFVFDESKAIQSEVFDAAEGTFSNAGTSGREAYALSISTPGIPAGFFYDIHSRKPGTEDWWARHVTVEETIAAGAVSRDWCEQRLRRWGKDSALYNNHVLGEFYSADEDGVIPLSWIEAANVRWLAWQAEGSPEPEGKRYVGVDVARSGGDETVMAIRKGNTITELRRTRREDTMQTVGRVVGIVHANPGMIPVVDVIGIGAGVVDRLREQNIETVAFNASEGTKRLDISGEMGFTNVRSAAWWNAREMLDPASDHDVALPPDDLLIGDLTAPHYRQMSGGRIQVEDKDAIRKRIGRSTDTGDSVVQSLWPREMSWRKAYGVVTCQHCGAPYLAELNPERCPRCRREQTHEEST